MKEENIHLAAIIEAQSLLAQASLNLPAFMELVVTKISELTPSSGSVVELVEGDEMVYHAGSGQMAPHVGMRINMSGSLSGLSVAEQKVLFCEDTETDIRVDRESCRKVDIASMVVAPLFRQGNAVGVIKISSSEKHAFSEQDVQTLEMMAGLLGSALAQQIQFETNQRLLQEKEATNLALQTSEQRMRMIIKSAHDAFVCMDEEGFILEWNYQAEQIYGWSREEAIGKELAALIIPEDRRAGHRSGMAAFAQTGKSVFTDQRMELKTVCRDGRAVFVELSLSTMKDGDRYIANAFVRDISKRKEVEQQLLYLARYDSLTGLANRRHFEEKLVEAMARSGRSKLSLTLMFMDIDHFKHINDIYGHAGGDEALIEFAARISKAIRITDTPARLAGDEFVIIFEGLKKEAEAHTIAKKILNALQEPFKVGRSLITVTASLGLAYYNQTGTSSDLLERADKALYQAKKKGRYQYAIAA